jgi:predicted nucleic acid-binding Zn ribbon protein
VHCPRCGTPNDPGDRFCSSCGAVLKTDSAPREQLSFRERLRRLLGTTRQARLLSAATVIALVVAVIAFIALKPSGDTIPRDAYTIAADRLCLDAKGEIVAVERGAGHGDTSAFARELVPIVAAWRSEFGKLHVPGDRTEEAQNLQAALLEAEIQIAQLARVAQLGNEKRTVESAEQADRASASVEEAVASLGLSHCAAATIGFSATPR